MNAAGQIVLEQQFMNLNQNQIHFSPDAGVYLIKVKGNGFEKTSRVFVN